MSEETKITNENNEKMLRVSHVFLATTVGMVSLFLALTLIPDQQVAIWNLKVLSVFSMAFLAYQSYLYMLPSVTTRMAGRTRAVLSTPIVIALFLAMIVLAAPEKFFVYHIATSEEIISSVSMSSCGDPLTVIAGNKYLINNSNLIANDSVQVQRYYFDEGLEQLSHAKVCANGECYRANFRE